MKSHIVPKGTMSHKALTPLHDPKTAPARISGRPYRVCMATAVAHVKTEFRPNL
jgi:hypothetical protein